MLPAHHTCFLVPGIPSAVAPARHRVVATVLSWGAVLGQDAQDSLCLVASELIGNAARHAGGLLQIRLQLDGCLLQLDVHDSSPQLPCPSVPDGDEPPEGGMGLHVLRTLTQDLGWELTKDGKRVWVKINLPGSAAVPRHDESVPLTGSAARSEAAGVLGALLPLHPAIARAVSADRERCRCA
jgi:anti-sigma regulatory factor (Ser/Thr protein kinase)